MTSDRDKSILEEPEKMCEYCCNFDKEHIGMDCTALCKLTMTLAYCEDYAGNCMFYNVPKEQIIVPPCKVGETIYYIHETFYDNEYMKAKEDELDFSHIIKVVERPNRKTNLMLEKAQFDWCLMDNWLKGDIFLTKEEAEEKLKELQNAETKKS